MHRSLWQFLHLYNIFQIFYTFTQLLRRPKAMAYLESWLEDETPGPRQAELRSPAGADLLLFAIKCVNSLVMRIGLNSSGGRTCLKKGLAVGIVLTPSGN